MNTQINPAAIPDGSITEEKLAFSTGGSADWDASEGEAGYIKGRPFYKEETFTDCFKFEKVDGEDLLSLTVLTDDQSLFYSLGFEDPALMPRISEGDTNVNSYREEGYTYPDIVYGNTYTVHSTNFTVPAILIFNDDTQTLSIHRINKVFDESTTYPVILSVPDEPKYKKFDSSYLNIKTSGGITTELIGDDNEKVLKISFDILGLKRELKLIDKIVLIKFKFDDSDSRTAKVRPILGWGEGPYTLDELISLPNIKPSDSDLGYASMFNYDTDVRSAWNTDSFIGYLSTGSDPFDYSISFRIVPKSVEDDPEQLTDSKYVDIYFDVQKLINQEDGIIYEPSDGGIDTYIVPVRISSIG